MSNEITITITVRLPDGVVPDVEYSKARSVSNVLQDPVLEEPPHVAEFPPLAEAPKYDADERATGQVQRDPPAPFCTLHGAMKRYPAGVSKSSGKTFNASWRCPVEKCPTKPLWDRDAA